MDESGRSGRSAECSQLAEDGVDDLGESALLQDVDAGAYS
jgi:hypothetical protein